MNNLPTSSVTTLPLWFKGRVLIWPIALLCSLMCLALVVPASQQALTHHSLTSVLTRVSMALLLMISLRLLDDLFDIGRDRVHHPNRVLCKAHNLNPFYGYCAVSIATASFYLFNVFGLQRIIALLFTLIFLFLCYVLLKPSAWQVKLREVLVLIKYPAIVILFSHNPLSNDVLLTALSVGVAVIIYDQLTPSHNP